MSDKGRSIQPAVPAEALLRDARAAVEHREYQRALMLYQQALTLNPSDAQTRRELAALKHLFARD